jgi:hypothetical protein
MQMQQICIQLYAATNNVPNDHLESAQGNYVSRRISCHTPGRRSDDDEALQRGVSPVDN